MKRDLVFGGVCIAMATLIFSSMEVMLKLPAVAGAFHPLQITMERFVVGGLCLIPIAFHGLKKRGVRLTAADLRYFALTGLLCVPLGMVLYQLAITYGQANIVAVLFSGNPLFVTALAFLLLHEAIFWNNLVALVFEVLGILAIIDPFGAGCEVSLTSVLLAILSALCFALYAVLGKRMTARVGSIAVTCFSFLFGAAELCVLLLLGRTGFAAVYQAVGLDLFCDVPFFAGLSTDTLPYFLFIGIVNCAAGYVFHMLAVEKTGATHGSLVFFFKPILAPLLALAILGEALTRPILIGIAFFLVGSLLSIVPELVRAKRAEVHAPTP